MPYMVKDLTPYPRIYPVTYPLRESILSGFFFFLFWKAYNVLTQQTVVRNMKKMHLCQSLSLSYLLFPGGNEYFSNWSEVSIEGKNSKEISLGEQEECINVIYFIVTVVRKQKAFFFSKCICIIDANILRFVTCNLYFGPSLTSSC